MAIYGVSLYGRDMYGPPQNRFVDYAVDPFIADAPNYDHITVTWSAPHGNWQEMRLVRNGTGFPATQDDGVVLLDTTGAYTSFTDANVTPGAWHYYALWILTGAGVWQRTATSCCLMLEEQGYSSSLFDSLPQWHRLTSGLMNDGPVVENDQLRRFLEVLAFGMNYVKTYYKSMLFLNDPTKNRTDQLLALAHQLGVDYSPVTPANLFRQRVASAGALGREKGTEESLRTLVSLATGYDVDLNMGPNQMLSEDQASFVHPSYPQYDSGVNYPTGTRVRFGQFLYAALVGNIGTPPTGLATSNTQWSYVSAFIDTTLKNPDGTFAGWSPVSFSAGVTPPTDQVAVGVGVQSPTDPTVSSANALAIQNTSGSTANLGARSAGGSTASNPVSAIKAGVPVARALPWDPTVSYGIGDVVQYLGSTYVGVSESLNAHPTAGATDSNWALNSPVDNRQAYTLSAHVKGTTSSAQARVAYPVVDLYDEHGSLLATLDGSVTPTLQIYDSLYTAPGNMSNRFTTVGGQQWTVNSGTWKVVSQVGAVSYSPADVSLVGQANGSLAVTFGPAAPGRTQSLYARKSGTSFLKFTRTAAYSVSSGVATSLGTYSTPFADGDRLLVVLNGSTITVQRNGAQVLSVTSTLNQTSTQHGILVE